MCNEKCKHGLGRGFFFFFFNNEIIYSIRLVPGSSPGQPIFFILKFDFMYRNPISISLISFSFHFRYSQRILIDLNGYWLTRAYKACYTVE